MEQNPEGLIDEREGMERQVHKSYHHVGGLPLLCQHWSGIYLLTL